MMSLGLQVGKTPNNFSVEKFLQQLFPRMIRNFSALRTVAI